MSNLNEKLLKVWNHKPVVFTSVLVMMIMYYPVGLLHESGHYLVGFNSKSLCDVNYLELGVHCSPTPQPFLLYWALGGIFGMIGSSSILFSRKVRTNKGILIGVLTTIFSQFINFFFETFAHFAYLGNFILGTLMATILCLFYLTILRFFTPRSRSRI